MGVVHKRIGHEGNWLWQDVDVFRYNSNNATKQVLIGRGEGANNFEIRYFTIPPRGFSNFDCHAHDHGVMIMQGKARVQLGERFAQVQVGDVIYIPSMEQHQFENLTDEPFTFLCIIPPKPLKND